MLGFCPQIHRCGVHCVYFLLPGQRLVRSSPWIRQVRNHSSVMNCAPRPGLASLKEAFFWRGSAWPSSELSRDWASGTVECSGTSPAAVLAEPGAADRVPSRVLGLFAAGPASEIFAGEDDPVGPGQTSGGKRAAFGAGRLGP